MMTVVDRFHIVHEYTRDSVTSFISRCQGAFAHGQMYLVETGVVTCIFCVTGTVATGVRWYLYADEKEPYAR